MKTFTKYIGDSYQSEWKRSVLLYEASLLANWFSSPKPLSSNPAEKSIVFEYLPPGQPFTKYLKGNQILKTPINETNAPKLFHKIGLALAEIHKFMNPATPEIIDMNDILFGIKGLSDLDPIQRETIENNLANAPIVAFHADFGLCNVWLGENDQLTVFDPVPSLFCPNPSAGRASIYYDLGHLISSIWIYYPINFKKIWDLNNPQYLQKMDSLIQSFQKGYEEGWGNKLHRDTLLATAFCLLNAYLRHDDYESRRDITWPESIKENLRISLRLKIMRKNSFSL